MQAYKNIHLCYKKAPICKLSCSKAPKRSKLAVADIRQKAVNFFNNTALASTLALEIIFKFQVSLQKFPFLVRYIIPCLHHVSFWSCFRLVCIEQYKIWNCIANIYSGLVGAGEDRTVSGEKRHVCFEKWCKWSSSRFTI